MKKMRKSFSLIAVLVCAVLCTQISAYAAEAELTYLLSQTLRLLVSQKNLLHI